MPIITLPDGGKKSCAGPVIDDGFIYDFAFERPLMPEDLVALRRVGLGAVPSSGCTA